MKNLNMHDPVMNALLNELNTLRTLKEQIYADAVKLDEELADVNQMQLVILQVLMDMYGDSWKQHDPESMKRQRKSMRYPQIMLAIRATRKGGTMRNEAKEAEASLPE